MKPKSIALGVIVAILALLGVVLFFTTSQPRDPGDIGAVSSVPSATQPPLTNPDDWPAPSGLASFGNQVKLLAFDLPANRFAPGAPIEVVLYWQSQTIPNTYNFFLHLIDTNNQLVSQADMPLENRACAALSRFSADVVVTCASLLLPADLAEGEYQLLTGVYNPASGQPLTAAGDQTTVGLTAIEVAEDGLTSAATPPPPCAVTEPNGSAPPGEQPSPEYLGNGQLWTVLWPDGKVIFEPGGPGTISEDGTLGMKWGWWRGVNGQLTIEGRRLDALAPPLQADIPAGYGETGIQATGLIFPTEGCWQVIGKAGEAELTFVTLVVKVGESQ